MNKIEVFIDIYRNPFPRGAGRYCYGNIRAINPSEQATVEECLIKMGDSPLLYNNLPIMHNGSPRRLLIEEDRQCILDTTKQKFEF